MGAMAELRPIIVIGSFMAIVVTLISIMPSGFFGSNATTVTPTNENFYSLLGTNDTLEYNLTGSSHDFGNKDFGGWHIDLQEVNVAGEPELWLQVADAWYSYFYNREDFIWYDVQNTRKSTTMYFTPFDAYPADHELMRITVINTDYLSGNVSGLIYYARCSRTTMKTMFYFDTTLYVNVTDAYSNAKLRMVVGIDFNERNTQINAWSIIGAFLTFQLIPNCELTLALLIEIPLWFAELYVVFIMVLRIRGAVFGGGGA
jgi:hypothetical protein